MTHFTTPPYVLGQASVQRVMLQVLLALLPGIAAYVWLVGACIVLQLAIATLAALAGEALMLRLRGRPLRLFLSDGSAIVTAWLIALTFPPLAPWWLIVVGALFAIVVAKQLYGGLGQNPFNPAMIAFAVCIVSFPALMSQWPVLGLKLSLGEQIEIIAGLAFMNVLQRGQVDILVLGLNVEDLAADHAHVAGTVGQFRRCSFLKCCQRNLYSQI